MNPTKFQPQKLGFLVVLFIGCTSRDRPEVPAAKPAGESVRSVQIAVLGDKTRIDLVSQVAEAAGTVAHDNGDNFSAAAMIASCRVTMTTARSDSVATHAPTCAAANMAVIAVDARNGPMPVHREH